MRCNCKMNNAKQTKWRGKKTHGEKKVCDGQRKVAIQSTHALNTIYTH